MSINKIPLYSLYTSEPITNPRTSNKTRSLIDSDLLMGVEYEVEDHEGDLNNDNGLWSVHMDASLRNGVEFVFATPLSGSRAVQALQDFNRSTHTFNTSERTSTHVHFNAGDGCTIGQVRSMFALMYMIEPAVFRIANEDRKWCSYCQPLTDYTPQRLIRLLASQQSSQFVEAARGERHQDKYYGMNMSSLHRHTTLEFRYFPGVVDVDVTLKWINLLQQIRAAAYKHHDPMEIISQFKSRESLTHYMRNELGPFANELLSNLVIDDTIQRASSLAAICSTDRSSSRVGNGGSSDAAQQLLRRLRNTAATALRSSVAKFYGVTFPDTPGPIDTSTPYGKIAAIFDRLDDHEADTVFRWNTRFNRALVAQYSARAGRGTVGVVFDDTNEAASPSPLPTTWASVEAAISEPTRLSAEQRAAYQRAVESARRAASFTTYTGPDQAAPSRTR